MWSVIELFVNTGTVRQKWTITVIVCYAKGKGRMTLPKLDQTDPVKLAASELAIQYGSHTDSDLPWTVRKYMSISKRKCKMLHKWCGARNSAVSEWHWLLLAVNQSRTSAASAVYWTPGNNVVSQSPSAWCVCSICASNWCGPQYKTIPTFYVPMHTCSAACKRCNALVKVDWKMWPTVWMMRF